MHLREAGVDRREAGIHLRGTGFDILAKLVD